MMTTLDGYPMARQGKAAEALVVSGVASFVGAFLATIGLMIFAPHAGAVSPTVSARPNISRCICWPSARLAGWARPTRRKPRWPPRSGWASSMIGLDKTTGMPRFTFGELHLMDGVDFLVAIVGLFAVAEVFHFIESHGKDSAIGVKLGKILVPWRMLRQTFGAMLRGTGIGFVAGVLPGAGASLGSFLAYMAEKSSRRAQDKASFGKGNPRGVAAPEAGNNAAAGGALVPMLTLGVPGSGTTAVLLALLLTLQHHAGPAAVPEPPEIVWSLIASLLIANVILLLMNVPMIKVFIKILSVPAWVLVPGVTIITFVGSTR